MPKRHEGTMSGFQLWVNLPAGEKMSVPAYRGLTRADFTEVTTDDGSLVKVVSGSYGGTEGPVKGISVDPTYLDVTVPAGGSFELETHPGYTAFAHAVTGGVRFDGSDAEPVQAGETALFGPGGPVRAHAPEAAARFLLVSGRPLHEPVAWYGPIVMNTQAQLVQAMRELRGGDFVKHRRPIVEE